MKEHFHRYSNEEAIRIATLIAAYIRGTISEKDHDELDSWVEKSEENMLLFEKLTDPAQLELSLKEMDEMGEGPSFQRIKRKIDSRKTERSWIQRVLTYSAAAAVLVIGTWWFVFRDKSNGQMEYSFVKSDSVDIPPPEINAILKLPDGKEIALETLTDNRILEEGSIRFFKKKDEVSLLEMEAQATGAEYSISVPGGGRYRLLLSDGTHVWINSASSVSFPAAFNNQERRVKITGEVFFDVAKENSRPFIVENNGISIKVLGTRFNVNAYKDEPGFKLTLLEGRVSAQYPGGEKTLIPGEELMVDTNGNANLKKIDTTLAVAWKENRFLFRDQTIEPVMRQLSRWYDIPIRYESIPSGHFTAEISRMVPVSKILRYLEMTGGVHFIIEKEYILVKR